MTSEDLYRILLKVYPTRYRHKYEQAMTQCFRDQLRAANTRGKLVRLWFHTIIDFALNAPARHLETPSRTPYSNAYSERARRAIYLARLEKGPFSYGEISLENLLLGALRSDEELTSALLGAGGIETLVTMVRARETNKVVPHSSVVPWERGRPRLGPTLALDCKKALARARQEAHGSGVQVSSATSYWGFLIRVRASQHVFCGNALSTCRVSDPARIPGTGRPNG